MSQRTPKAIYFDLGNVLLTFDHLKACQQMANAAGISMAHVRTCLFDGPTLQHAYERGELSTSQFCDRFRSHLGVDVEDSELLLAASDMFEMNAAMLPITTHLRERGYELGILSNTCEAHWEFVTGGRYEIFHHFTGPCVLSYEVRAMKPDPSIYQAAIKAMNCDPGEIFFTDDREENVHAARQAGIDAVQFTTAGDLLRDLSRRGIDVLS